MQVEQRFTCQRSEILCFFGAKGVATVVWRWRRYAVNGYGLLRLMLTNAA